MTEKPAVYTAAGLKSLTDSGGGQYGSVNNVLKSMGAAAKEIKSLLETFKGVQGLAEQAGMKMPQQDQHIPTKIEKGINQRIEQAQPRKQRIAFHIEAATNDVMGMIDSALKTVDEKKTVAELIKELKPQLDRANLRPFIEAFLRKHTELFDG